MEELAGQSEGVGAAQCICKRDPEMAVIAGVVWRADHAVIILNPSPPFSHSTALSH
jgi:hypothetical protein